MHKHVFQIFLIFIHLPAYFMIVSKHSHSFLLVGYSFRLFFFRSCFIPILLYSFFLLGRIFVDFFVFCNVVITHRQLSFHFRKIFPKPFVILCMSMRHTFSVGIPTPTNACSFVCSKVFFVCSLNIFLIASERTKHYNPNATNGHIHCQI